MAGLLDSLNPIPARARQAAARESVWAIWRYDAEAWRQYDAATWQRIQRRLALELGAGVLWIAVVISFMRLALPAGPLFADFFFLLVPLWGIGMMAGWTGLCYRRSLRYHRARQQGPAEIRIGPLAVVEPGGPIPLAGSGGWGFGDPVIGFDPFSPPMLRLRSVALEGESPVRLRFNGWGGRSWPTSVTVPVPAGREAEAAALVARFQHEILSG